MKALEFIKKHQKLIFLAVVEGIALFGIICGFIGLTISTFASEDSIWWFLFFDLPLVLFVLWVWCKAIIPWSMKIIDMESKQKED